MEGMECESSDSFSSYHCAHFLEVKIEYIEVMSVQSRAH